MAKNESKTDIELFNYLTNVKKFSSAWVPKKTENQHIQEILKKASKNGTENRGEPDLIYLNENRKLLILIENKDLIKDHKSKNGTKPKDYAVDGIKHYLNFFAKNSLGSTTIATKKYLEDFRIIGIAFSGKINDINNHLCDTFSVNNEKIDDLHISEFLDENDYISLFENLDLEQISSIYQKVQVQSIEV
jgi:type I restriction enzyme M protein